MHIIKQILANKPVGDIWHVSPNATVYEAIEQMALRRAGALLVMSGPALDGIISERDYAREVILQGRASKDTQVKEIMTSRVYTVELTTSVDTALAIMTEKHIRHLPVVEGEDVVGVVSIGDLVKEVISEKQETIEQLENYIRG